MHGNLSSCGLIEHLVLKTLEIQFISYQTWEREIKNGALTTSFASETSWTIFWSVPGEAGCCSQVNFAVARFSSLRPAHGTFIGWIWSSYVSDFWSWRHARIHVLVPKRPPTNIPSIEDQGLVFHTSWWALSLALSWKYVVFNHFFSFLQFCLLCYVLASNSKLRYGPRMGWKRKKGQIKNQNRFLLHGLVSWKVMFP